MNATEDERILSLFEERNEQALAETVSQYGTRCRNVARNILGSEEDAEECMNDALLSAWNAIPPARPRHYGAYFLTLVRNFALKRYAAGHAEKRGGGQMPLALAELSDCLSSGENVEREIDRRAMLEAVRQFRRYWYAAPISEIAEDFEMTDINVKVTLSRIRNRLQKHLRKEGLL